MSRALKEVSSEGLSRRLREARERKGWTIEQLARELWLRGYPTSQNKLWRMENKPPARVDTELLLWLEKVLEVELLDGTHKFQVLIEDVIGLIEAFHAATPPPPPEGSGLRGIHQRLQSLLQQKAG